MKLNKIFTLILPRILMVLVVVLQLQPNVHANNSKDSVVVNPDSKDSTGSSWYPVQLYDKLQNPHLSNDSIVTIVTEPSDAAIYVDTVLLGYSPAKIPLNSRIIIRKKGYEPLIAHLDSKKGKQEFVLQRLPFSQGEQFFETNTFQLVSAAIIVFGGTAAYLKIQADENFDKYQNSGETRYLDKTKRFDIYSGIAFGVMQVNFGYLVYKFLVSP